MEAERVNLQKLISTGTLIEFVKNNNQSRLFQNYLTDSTSEEIEEIITHIGEKLVELITH